MSKKNSLFDDPLGDDPLGLTNNNNDNFQKKGLIFDNNNNNNDDVGLFKTLDSTKINLKKDKNQIKTIQQQQQQQHKPFNHAEKGLGFTTNLWDNDNINTSKSKNLDDLLVSATASSSSSSNDTLFGNNDLKANDAFTIGMKMNQNTDTNKGKVNTGDLDDNKLDDLKVGKLIEKEDELDYDLFGKKNIVQARSVGTILHKQKNVSETEDLEIDSAEVLDNLEKVTLKENVFTRKIIQKAVALNDITIPAVADDIDISKFDINAYINENSGGGGGLFD